MRTHITLLCTLLSISSMLVAQSWTPVADLPTGRHHPVTFALDGKGYSATGTISGGTATKTFYEYDPISDTWSTKTDFPGDARGYAIGVVHNDLAYLGFGAGQFQYLNDLWSYDAQNDQWTQLASCPCTARTHPAMIAANNKIYVGLGNDGQNLNDWWEYSIATDSWNQMFNLPGVPRHHPFQFAAGGDVFAGMGHGNGIFNDWYKLDTNTNIWTAMTDFPGEARVAGTQFDHAGIGYVLSGDGDNHSFMPTGEFWRYDAPVDTWTQLTPHPGISRWAPGSFVIDNEVYLFGGVDKQTSTYPVSVYRFNLAPVSVGVQEGLLSEISAFPNPFNDRVTIQTENLGQMQYRIWSVEGNLIQQGAILSGNISTEGISNGMFMLEILDASGQIIAKERMVKLGE